MYLHWPSLFFGAIAVMCATLLGVAISRFLRGKKEVAEAQKKLHSPPGNGNLRRIRTLNEELTEKERELLKANAKFEALFEHAPVMIGSFDASGVPDLWNKECERVFGYTRDEIIGNSNALELFYGDEAADVVKDIRRASGEFIEYTPKTKAGRRIKTMWANMPLPDGSIISVGCRVEESSPSKKPKKEKCNTTPRKRGRPAGKPKRGG